MPTETPQRQRAAVPNWRGNNPEPITPGPSRSTPTDTTESTRKRRPPKTNMQKIGEILDIIEGTNNMDFQNIYMKCSR
ncbi:hypothetical protein BDZ97DRAFT_1807076, partial [Flammula alnicola]